MHKTIEPTILYFGTPVALISTLNQDGTPNLAPMSSAWWLGWSCMLGHNGPDFREPHSHPPVRAQPAQPGFSDARRLPGPYYGEESRAGEKTGLGISLR